MAGGLLRLMRPHHPAALALCARPGSSGECRPFCSVRRRHCKNAVPYQAAPTKRTALP